MYLHFIKCAFVMYHVCYVVSSLTEKICLLINNIYIAIYFILCGYYQKDIYMC